MAPLLRVPWDSVTSQTEDVEGDCRLAFSNLPYFNAGTKWCKNLNPFHLVFLLKQIALPSARLENELHFHDVMKILFCTHY